MLERFLVRTLINNLYKKEPKIDDKGQPSQKYRGKNAEVVINPETGNIISGWRK